MFLPIINFVIYALDKLPKGEGSDTEDDEFSSDISTYINSFHVQAVYFDDFLSTRV